MVKRIGAQPMGIREWVPDLSILLAEQDVVEVAAVVEDAVVDGEEVVEAALALQMFHRLRQKRPRQSMSTPCMSRLSGGSTSGRLTKPRQTATFLANMPFLPSKPLDRPPQIPPYIP